MKNLILLSFLLNIVLGCSKPDNSMLCDEVAFEGNWHVKKHITRKNIESLEIIVLNSQFKMNFFSDNQGYYNNNLDDTFIWGTQCTPYNVLISNLYLDRDSTLSDFYQTELFSIDVNDSSQDSVTLYRNFYSFNQDKNEYVEIYWHMARQ